jgi:hypothetical protein
VNVFSDRIINLSRWNGDGIPVNIPGLTTIGNAAVPAQYLNVKGSATIGVPGTYTTNLTVNGSIGCGHIGCDDTIGCYSIGCEANVNCANVNATTINGDNWADLMTRIGRLESIVLPPP